MYAAIGRKQTELDTMHTEYNNLLSVLSQVKDGKIGVDRVMVDLDRRVWAIAPEAEKV